MADLSALEERDARRRIGASQQEVCIQQLAVAEPESLGPWIEVSLASHSSLNTLPLRPPANYYSRHLSSLVKYILQQLQDLPRDVYSSV